MFARRLLCHAGNDVRKVGGVFPHPPVCENLALGNRHGRVHGADGRERRVERNRVVVGRIMDEVKENHLILGVVHHVRVSLADALKSGRQVVVGEDAAQALAARVSDLIVQDALGLTRVRGDSTLG